MRFTLKEYQEDAVVDVLNNLRKARRTWRQDRDPSSFSLTATTGAGKTVMAAAVIEALFNGNDECDFDADPGAVVLWFTDDPALNEQTRFRLNQASDVGSIRSTVIDNSFQEEQLSPGQVYFLNSQKLGKNSLLVRGAPETDRNGLFPMNRAAPDMRAHTMWDVLRNTIEDESLTLYLILDEAHRGMNTRARQVRERATIVQRMVNGDSGIPPIPVVIGISATVERFNTAMSEAQGRVNYPNVVVDPVRVQASGLLKDDIRLEFPAEAGQFDTVLLKRAVRRTLEISELWKAYAEAQEPPEEPVSPLLVVQMPNTPDDELLKMAFDTVRDEWPELKSESLAHVFGEHKTLEIGGHAVPHVSPETLQDRPWIRVVFAKEAITTGWDCPRAEVLMSFRPAKDETHITQLLGRMVRAPLARRIPGDDRLNSVECILPHFNRETAKTVGEMLLGLRDPESGGSGGGEGRRVLYAPVDMLPNPAISDSVWTAFDALPSLTLPRRVARPMKRLMALAYALSRDNLLPGGRKKAYAEMLSVLDGLLARHAEKVEKLEYGILEVEGESLQVGISEPSLGNYNGKFSEFADERSVEADFRDAGRVFSRELALQFADRIALDGEDDDGLFDAHIKVAALARIEGVAETLEEEADKLARLWLNEHRVAIKGLPDARRVTYADIVEMSTDPQRVDILRPRIRAEETQDENGASVAMAEQHLMSDEKGKFPIGSLNNWERKILKDESARPNFLGWYRNPGRGSEDSLSVPYKNAAGFWSQMFPDFVFFHGDSDIAKAAIVDPHGDYLSDALPKLQGLALFAEQFGDELHRIEATAEIDGAVRVLDLTQEKVRAAIAKADNATQVYASDVAQDY